MFPYIGAQVISHKKSSTPGLAGEGGLLSFLPEARTVSQYNHLDQPREGGKTPTFGVALAICTALI